MAENKEKRIKKRELQGIVVSDKMDKTVIVEVKHTKTHPVYKKQYKISKRYKAHDENNTYKIKDEVIIVESKPRSREKRWEVKLLSSQRKRI